MATVRYIVENVDEAVDFYVSHLGFEVKQAWGPPFAQVERGDLELWLAGPGSSARRPMPDGAEPVAGGWNRLVIQVDDLATTVEGLRRDGATFRNDIVTGPGGQQILVEDPSGNCVELFQPDV